MRKTVLITGATKGIGLATAQRLHKKGHHVIGIVKLMLPIFLMIIS